jgi:peptide/nickel transport system permease protein
MTAYIIRRLLLLPLILSGLVVLVFGLTMLLDPIERASLYVNQTLPKGKIEDLIERHGLDKPIHIQFYRWINRVVRGDLGWSRTAQQPVTSALLHFLPATIELSLWSIIPVILIGVWLGVMSALYHNRFVDHLLRVISIVGWSFPPFVFGLLMLMVFYAKYTWFPARRLSEWAVREVLSPDFVQYTRLHTVDALLNLRPDIFWDAMRHLVLPVTTLSYLNWALLLRVTRSSMLEALNQDYVRTARSKGLKESVVIGTHVLRNALIPVATMGGLLIIGLLNGVVITETVFNYKGIGWFFANAALHLDIISVLGFTLFNGALIVLGNLAVDISYGFLDPRVRLR